MEPFYIKNGLIVNEGREFKGGILINNGIIEKISGDAEINIPAKTSVINAEGMIVIPGVIDEHVHFREPGLTHKGNIESESMAAVAGGVTSFMDMPNTLPNAVTIETVEEKFRIAAGTSLANYSFYLGATNSNLGEIKKADYGKVCGIKIFLGSSTGNMLVNDLDALEKIFSLKGLLIAVHSEDEKIIMSNLEKAKMRFGDDIPVKMHPEIRSAEACFMSTKTATDLARKFNTRLHILHVSSSRELGLFDKGIPLERKMITAEVCIPHLVFSDDDYSRLGSLIKVNPAVKTETDRKELLKGLAEDRLDVVATDHAPHTLAEKQQNYLRSPSGSPMIQHSLSSMLEFYHQGILSLPKVIEKMCHAPAVIFKISKRGFIREGFHADLAIVNLNKPFTIKADGLLYKCRWTPLEGRTLRSSVTHTFVNGNLVFDNGRFYTGVKGQRLKFN
jgi:dihydroorotase